MTIRAEFGINGVYVAVISHARPDNVEAMQALIGDATWIVGEGETDAYEAAGAYDVLEGGGLCESRNLALKVAFDNNVPCVELSDDLRGIKTVYDVTPEGKNLVRDISFVDAVEALMGGAFASGAKLAGCAPTNNPFYANFKKPVGNKHFIVGDFIFVRPCELFFDERLKLKEDYDYTLAHLHDFGTVARLNLLLPTFVHRTNPGGACDFRTAEREQDAIAYLRYKWGSKHIVDNPKRPDEVLMRWP